MSRIAKIQIGNTSALVDYKELQRQRGALSVLEQFPCLSADIRESLCGLQNFLDAFVDASADVLGDELVFGRRLK